MDDVESTYRHVIEENKRLKRAVGELSILNEVALAISGSLDSEKIIRTIISRSIRAIEAEQGDITLVVENHSNPAQTLVRSMDNSGIHSPLHLNQNLMGWMQIHKKPLLINEPRNDERFKNVSWEETVESIVCAPLLAKSKLIGIVTLYNKKGGMKFDESDKRLLSIIAAQSAQVVENARLYEEEQALKEMRKEMEMASAIQIRMLPSSSPELNGYSMGGRNLTAKSVGGDYYDFIRISDDKWAICLGDISGKGLAASLLMSNLQAILRGQIYHLETPSDILKHANTQLFHNTNAEKFATLFLGILNTSTHRLQFSSAGHEYPIFSNRDCTIRRLEANGIPLGILESAEYRDESIELNRGDSLFIYSDGITECINDNEEEFGETRLEDEIRAANNFRYQPEKLIDIVFDACFEHTRKQQLFDDMTAVVLARSP